MQFSLSVYMSMTQVVDITRTWRGWLLTIFPSTNWDPTNATHTSQIQCKQKETTCYQMRGCKTLHGFKRQLDKYLRERQHGLLDKTTPVMLRRCPGQQRPPMGAADICLCTCCSTGPRQGRPTPLLTLQEGFRERCLPPGVDSSTHLMKSRIWPVDTLIQRQA